MNVDRAMNTKCQGWRQITLRVTSIFICFLWLNWPPMTAQAHGGVIIDGGFTDQYEWLVAVNPFPITPGDTVLTLLIYDLKTYAPVNGLNVTMYLAAPDSPRPCCNVEQHIGPLESDVQPELYPGDYSRILDIDQEGEWEVQFVVEPNTEAITETLMIVVPFEVKPADPNQPRPTIEDTTNLVATSAEFAENVENAREELKNSQGTPEPNETADGVTPTPQEIPTATPRVEVEIPVSSGEGNNWLLWGMAGLIPLIGLVVWFLWKPEDEFEDDIEAGGDFDDNTDSEPIDHEQIEENSRKDE